MMTGTLAIDTSNLKAQGTLSIIRTGANRAKIITDAFLLIDLIYHSDKAVNFDQSKYAKPQFVLGKIEGPIAINLCSQAVLSWGIQTPSWKVEARAVMSMPECSVSIRSTKGQKYSLFFSPEVVDPDA